MTEEERETMLLLRQCAKAKLERLYALTDEQVEAITDPEQEMAEATAFKEYAAELRHRDPDDREVMGHRAAAGLFMARTKILFGLLK